MSTKDFVEAQQQKVNVFDVLREKLKEKAEIYMREEEIQKSNPCYQRGVYGFKSLGYENAIEIVNQVEHEYNNGWIPCDVMYPDTEEYILLSFENFTIPIVGRYEVDERGGAFYAGDKEETLVSQGLFVNAWSPLPKPYREKEV